MQKKIVAAICAAALALAMPVAAFAKNANFTGAGSELTAQIGTVENGKVTLKNIVLTGSKSMVASAEVIADGTGAAPSNAIANSSARFVINAYGSDRAAVSSLGVKYNSMTADVDFAESVVANLNVNNDRDNLYVAGRFVSNEGGVTIPLAAKKLSIAGEPIVGNGTVTPAAVGADGTIELTNLGTGTLTVWMQEGKYAAGDANTADVAKEAQDGSKSPKTGELL